MKHKINILTGATATGKSEYAISLAKDLDGVIINADSMQIYKEIPILTAQPSKDEFEQAEHRLYGHTSCSQYYSVASWIKEVKSEIQDILSKNKTPILVGGTGFYIKSLVDGLSDIPDISTETKNKLMQITDPFTELRKVDPITAEQLFENDLYRINRGLEVFIETGKPISEWKKQPITKLFPREDFYLIHYTKPRDVLYQRINDRLILMLENGAIEEVKKLYETFGDINYPRANGLYEIISFLKGEINMDALTQKIQQSSRNYAKRQLTFFRNQLQFDKEI